MVGSGGRLLALERNTGKKIFELEGEHGVPALGDGTCVCAFTDEEYETGLVAVTLSSGKRRWFVNPNELRATNKSLCPELSSYAVPVLWDGKVLVGCYGVCAFA